MINDPASLRAKVAKSSFYAGMRVLPRAEREAMYAVYGFCRLVDDIADDLAGDRAGRAAALAQWRSDIDALYAGSAAGQADFLRAAVAQFGLQRADFHAVIDGMAMDVAGDIRWPDAATLDVYCDRVASAVGRLSVRIFGMAAEPGLALAHHLGRALQLTNILRDIDEDAAIGRVYLPGDALPPPADRGMATAALAVHITAEPAIDAAARAVAATARQHFAAAGAIMAARPRGHLTAPRLMAAVYAPMLDRMLRTGWHAPRTRLRTSKITVLGALFRVGLRAGLHAWSRR
jgi:presqualene diphosphate synthase